MAKANQNPEQMARDQIDKMLEEAGWNVQARRRSISTPGRASPSANTRPTSVLPTTCSSCTGKRSASSRPSPRIGATRSRLSKSSQRSYAAAKLKWVNNKEPLPFVYESTGIITRFTDGRDPKPRSREVFTFHRPETMAEWLSKPTSLRARLHDIPPLNPAGLRDCQITAIENLEKSFQDDRPRALVQMATGSGKTFTAITSVYRLLKYADAKRILFLVDTKNLGEQAEQEFMSYLPNDDNRKFTELYNVQRLKSSIRRKEQPGLHQHHPAHVLAF